VPAAIDITKLAREYDVDDMARVIKGTPDQIGFALSDPDFPDLGCGTIERVVVVGMGGSALPVDVLTDAFAETLRVPVAVCRNYELPRGVDDRTLLIASSFSGNTEETLAPLERHSTLPPNVVVLTAGGRLADLARERGYPLVLVPKHREVENFQPRCATGYFTTYFARILAAVGALDDPAAALDATAAFLRTLDVRERAEEAAQWIAGRIPVFYTDQVHERSIARITKIKFNENAKSPAFFNCLPEANHNEMIGLAQPPGRYALFYLRDPASDARVHRRFETMRSVFASRGIDHVEFDEWTMPGSTTIERIFASLTFADWASYTLALLNGHNPTPVALVEDFKKAMG